MATHGEPFGIEIGVASALGDSPGGYGLAVDADAYVSVPFHFGSAVGIITGG